MDVPEDIREKARGIVAEIDADWTYDGQVFDFSNAQRDVENAVCQALLSERLAQKERDAKIAETFGARSRSHDIAAAIRES